MAQQDKTDFYWNGVLSGAVNNLYYDLINVDVCHVPYATNHRNSSFFLKTRLAYQLSKEREEGEETEGYEVTDIKILRGDNCTKDSGEVYIMGRKGTNKAIWHTSIVGGCIVNNISKCIDDIYQPTCASRKLFSMEYVKGKKIEKNNSIGNNDPILKKIEGTTATEKTGKATGVQINKMQGGTSYGLFSDINVENSFAEFRYGEADSGNTKHPQAGDYLLVYRSANGSGDGFAGQVRMITGIDNRGRLTVDAPWLGFKVPSEDDVDSDGNYTQFGYHVKYAIFKERGEIVGFTDNKNIEILYDPEYGSCAHMTVYNQTSSETTSSARGTIVGVADANDKMFVLTDNGFIHYSTEYGYNKFFINEDMFAGVDKMSIIAYRDMVLAFGRRHIAIGVPDEQNRYWTMYNQSATIGLWNRYSYSEFDGKLLFVSNDKRLLTLQVNAAGRYGLTFDEGDGTDRINGKLSMLVPGDEVYIGADNNELRVFINYSSTPYKKSNTGDRRGDYLNSSDLTSTHIYKYNTLFQVWTEDHINGILLKGAEEGAYYGEGGIYIRDNSTTDEGGREFTTRIDAYLIENESNGLDNHPLLFQLAKLNRLITTLGPGIYSDTTKIKITTYSKGIGYTYEFPINGDGNNWLGLMTSYYLEEDLDEEQEEKINCMLSTLQDGQIQYQPNCPEGKVQRHYVVQSKPWCHDYDELLTESHGVCINDRLYELAPTMPLVTSLGENQTYSTQIKIELIGGKGDIITFGGWLAELYLAPLGLTGPDGEYQLQPQTDC